MEGIKDRAVMGIDASLTGFAVAVVGPHGTLVEEKKTEAKQYPRTIEGRMDRMVYLVDFAVRVCKTHSPYLLLIEEYAYNAKGSSGVTLGELGGILRHRILGIADYTAEVPPQIPKKFVTGKGNASKLQVVQALARRYNMEFKTDNEADAFALAKLGRVVAGYEQAQTKQQEEAAKTVRDLLY